MLLTNVRGRKSFDDGWTWHLGDDISRARRLVPKAGTANGWSDLSNQEIQHHNGSKTFIENMKKAFQAIQLRPDDSEVEWLPVHLPHDWRIRQKPSPRHDFPEDYAKAWNGWWPTGVAYYRKVFAWTNVPGTNVRITFDGIAGLSDVWLNGFWVGQSTSSYTPLSIDVTELLRSNLPNVLLVRTDSTEAEGWWMEGGGIYRHVWLETYGDVHVEQHGIHISTPTVTKEKASVMADIEIGNKSGDLHKIVVEGSVIDPRGDVCAHVKAQEIQNQSYRSSLARLEAVVENPELWDIGAGRLYTMRVEVSDSATSEVLDVLEQSFGIREIRCDMEGIVVNGRKSKIYGVNIHQDFGFYGSALPDRIIEAKLDMLVEMGVNTVRSAHHQATPEMVAHMDRRGILLIAENRTMSSAEHALKQLRQQIRQYRSHPSIFIWSLENEELNMEGEEMGRSILRRLIRECRALDPSRPVTCGGVEKQQDLTYYGQLDVVGTHYPCFNGNLDEVLSHLPEKPHLLDEEGLFSSTRGVYQYDSANSQSGSFARIDEPLFDGMGDVFGDNPPPFDPSKLSPQIHDNMALCFTSPKIMGGCIWTGFDYHGEPIPQKWPAIIGSLGQRDCAGIPKDYYWLVRSIFKSEPLVHGFPHWTWPGKEGNKIPFAIYSNCDEVEVSVNEKTIARLPVKNFRALVPNDGLPYQPGRVTVRGYRGSKAVAEHVQQTAGAAASLRLIPDRTDLSSNGHDLAIVRIIVTDKDGNFVPEYSGIVNLSVSGNGYLEGSSNGNTVFVDESWDRRENVRFWKGQAVMFMRAREEIGSIKLTAKLEEVEDSRTHLWLQVKDSVDAHEIFPASDEREVSAYGTYRNL